MSELNHAAALRAIGQDLHRRGLKTFDLRVEGNDYVADCGYQEPPAATPVNLRYTLDDIEALDSRGKIQRGKPSSRDFWTLVQVLRTIGGYLDRNKARLVRVTNNHPSGEEPACRVESESAKGEIVVESWSHSALYDVSISLYRRRSRSTGTGGSRR